MSQVPVHAEIQCALDQPRQVPVDSVARVGYLRIMKHDDSYDASGLLCPMPVLKARKRLQGLQPGQILRLTATDPAAIVDVPHFCSQSGHELVDMHEIEGAQVYFIRKH